MNESRLHSPERYDGNSVTNSMEPSPSWEANKFSAAIRSTLFCGITQCMVGGNSLPTFRDNLSVPSSRFNHHTPRNIPEESRLHLLGGGSHKSPRFSASQESPRILLNRRFLTSLTSARHLSLFWTRTGSMIMSRVICKRKLLLSNLR